MGHDIREALHANAAQSQTLLTNRFSVACSALAIAAAFAFTGCSSGDAQDAKSEETAVVQSLVTNGTIYNFKPQHVSGKCMDANGNGTSNGTNIHMWSCNNSTAQKFKAVASSVSGYYKLIIQNGSNLCVDVAGGSAGDGANVQLWSCNGAANQDFRFDSSNGQYRIVARHSGKCLDVAWAGTTDGTNIAQVSCNGNLAQTFATVALSTSSSPPPPSGGTNCAVYTHSSAGPCGWWTYSDCCNPCTYGSTSTCPGSTDSGGGGGTTTSGMKTVGYVVSWRPNISVPYSKLTHINYAFILPNSNGTLQPLDNPGWLQTVVSNAHNNGGKVLISVGGWMYNSPSPSEFASLAANSGYRSTFVNALVSLVNQYNLDGVDIDWEYPCNSSYYGTLMSELGSAMSSRGKLLTAAVAAYGGNANCFPSSAFNSVNFLNVMAYDLRDPNHSTYQDAVDSVNYWKGRGLGASKVILGLPIYAHPSWKAYNTKVAENGANRCRDSDGYDYWNGIKTIRSKAAYARANAGGVMEWETSQDTTGSDSLITAMWEAVNGRAGSYPCP